MRHALVTVAVVALAGIASLASAESKKYPPRDTDKDREADQKSRLWESTLHPEQHAYEDIIAAQEQPIMRDGRPDRVRTAIAELDKAIVLQPKRHEAYQLRGAGYDKLANWAQCAADLELADKYAPRDPDDPRFDHRRRLGVCEARSGKYAAAEQTLAALTAAGSRDGETWLRLGEVRIALGKLDEAISALTQATEAGDSFQNTARWMLALAYDRARMPGEAARDLELLAQRYDPGFSVLINPQSPFLGVAESDYLLGLAYGAQNPPRPEVQQVYFLRYLKLAVDSPWRKRAEEHLKEIRAVELPEREDALKKRYGAVLDMGIALQVIRKGMPAMRTCMAKAQGLVLKVLITRAGPRSPSPEPSYRMDPWDGRARPRPIMSAPPVAGITITQDAFNVFDVSRTEIDAAIRCIEPIADKLKLPVVKEKDSAYAVEFTVVAP